MKTLILTVAAAALCAGCVSTATGKQGGGRYFQQTNQLTDEVMMQMDAITDKSCQIFLSETEPEYKHFFRCSSTSAADKLTWRAIYYNPYLQAPFVIDADSFAYCHLVITSVLEEGKKNKLEGKVSMPCTEK